MGKSLHKDMMLVVQSTYPDPPVGNHLRRLTTMVCMICSCMHTKSSSIEGLSSKKYGRSGESESRVKQSSRWLSSKWTDWAMFFAPFARQLLATMSSKGELLLVVDGSQTGANCCTLMLSVVCKGYAIPIVWLTKSGEKGHFSEEIHLDLIKYVEQLLPESCRVVFLGDGEFDGSKLRSACKKYGWEFVLRTSKDRKVDCGGEIVQINTVCPFLGERMVFLEDACEGDNAICWHGKGYDAPIYLLTNMDLGQMACAYYRKRFKIETLFKYLKSGGFKLQKSMIESPEKIRNLIIIVAFAFIFTFIIGILLKNEDPKVISKITRKDRLECIHPITLGQKCFAKARKRAKRFFSKISKNWSSFFT